MQKKHKSPVQHQPNIKGNNTHNLISLQTNHHSKHKYSEILMNFYHLFKRFFFLFFLLLLFMFGKNGNDGLVGGICIIE